MVTQKKFFEMLDKASCQLSTTARTVSKIFAALSKNPELVGLLRTPAVAPVPVPAPASGVKKFNCTKCDFHSDNKTDWKRHIASSRHLERIECPFELSTRYNDKLFDKIRKKYKELAKEKNIFRLMAFIFLKNFHYPDKKEGTQCIYGRSFEILWGIVHTYEYGGGFYMEKSTKKILNRIIGKESYTFQVFEEMWKSATAVLEISMDLIEKRGRYRKFGKSKRNWEKFDDVTREGATFLALPRFLKDKTASQKKEKVMSLHEYLQTCR